MSHWRWVWQICDCFGIQKRLISARNIIGTEGGSIAVAIVDLVSIGFFFASNASLLTLNYVQYFILLSCLRMHTCSFKMETGESSVPDACLCTLEWNRSQKFGSQIIFLKRGRWRGSSSCCWQKMKVGIFCTTESGIMDSVEGMNQSAKWHIHVEKLYIYSVSNPVPSFLTR